MISSWHCQWMINRVIRGVDKMEKLSFIFPGQGAQFVQMGQSFYNNYLISRQTYDEAQEVLDQDIAKLCFEGRISELNDFTNMQIAIVTTEVAIYRAYVQEFGIIPQFLAGHSIGEYSSLVCAGAISFRDILKILKKRGQLVQSIIDAEIGRMTIVEKVNCELITNIIRELGLENRVFISCYNSTSQLAISGYNEDLDIVEEKLVQVGSVISPLFISPPMHSPLMNDIKDEFKQFLETFEYHPFRFPIISNVTGAPFSDCKAIPELLSSHLIKPVRWENILAAMYQYGITATIEMSPKLLLSSFVAEAQPRMKTFCYCIKKDRLALSEMFKADTNYTKDVPNLLGRCLGILVTTENKNEDAAEFNKVLDMYRAISKMYTTTVEKKLIADYDDEVKAVQMLIDALKIKKVDNKEIKDWIKILLDETGSYYRLRQLYQSI